MRVRPHLPRTKPQAEHWTEKDGTDNVICDHSIQQHMYAYVNLKYIYIYVIIIIDIYIYIFRFVWCILRPLQTHNVPNHPVASSPVTYTPGCFWLKKWRNALERDKQSKAWGLNQPCGWLDGAQSKAKANSRLWRVFVIGNYLIKVLKHQWSICVDLWHVPHVNWSHVVDQFCFFFFWGFPVW